MIYQRLLTGLVCLPVLFLVIRQGDFWFPAALVICATIAIIEFIKMTAINNQRNPWLLSIVWTISFLAVGLYSLDISTFFSLSLVILIVGAFLNALRVIIFCEKQAIYRTWVISSLGPIYIGFCLAHALALRNLGLDDDLGRNWILFSIVLIFTSDTGAYIIGRTIGKHPIAPRFSPNKTWEGTIAGFILVLVAALSMNKIFFPEIIYWQVLLIGATVGFMAPIGDLFESKLKRIYGMKDTGSILPGHGGMLDRLDSILLAIPFVYYYAITIEFY